MFWYKWDKVAMTFSIRNLVSDRGIQLTEEGTYSIYDVAIHVLNPCKSVMGTKKVFQVSSHQDWITKSEVPGNKILNENTHI